MQETKLLKVADILRAKQLFYFLLVNEGMKTVTASRGRSVLFHEHNFLDWARHGSPLSSCGVETMAKEIACAKLF